MKRPLSPLSIGFALVLATTFAAFAACESADAPGGPDAGGGGDPIDAAIVLPPDAMQPIDAAPPPDVTPPADAMPLLGPDGALGVTCGAASCDDNTQECCVALNGGNPTFTCVDIGTCAETVFGCDGPEDCMGNACCAPVDIQNMTLGDATCSATPTCGGGFELQVCHNDPDCPVRCCPTAVGVNYCSISIPGVGECPI